MSSSAKRQPARSAASGEPTNAKTFATIVFGMTALNKVFRKISTSGKAMGNRERPMPGSLLSSIAAADLTYSSLGNKGSFRVMQYKVAAMTEGTETTTPHKIALPSGRWSKAAAATGPGVGGTSEAVTSAPI